MTEPAAQDSEFAALIAELKKFRAGRLKGLPSDRALAKAAGVSATTVGNWLGKGQFPQAIDSVLVVVRAVRAQAQSMGMAVDPAAAALWDPDQWRRAYRAGALRRARGIGTAVEAGQSRAVLERMQPGLPLSEVDDPFQLEVHRAIGSPGTSLPVLPVYVPREHDRALAEVVAQAADRASRIAVLVGGSSTGKTRACWEALRLLREQGEPWRLWHPIDPGRPEAALAELADLAPYTVVWLNEAQFYLAHDQLGEQVAAGLRALLRDRTRGPVLVLATLWPKYWDDLTVRTDADRHAQARELLDGHRIKVPDSFTVADLTALNSTIGHDPRLGEAAERASDGQITQYLAGVPVLMDRYEDAAPPATKALIYAAMDARRLGAGVRIPLAWLVRAVPGYLTETQWDQTRKDWLKGALKYATRPCNGIPGILTPVKTGASRKQRNRRADGTENSTVGQGPLYRLADYLDQHGRRHRAEMIPPLGFWTAAAIHAHPTDLTALGNAAWDRGLYRCAAQLHKHATTHGDPHGATELIGHLHSLNPTDRCPAQWVTTHVAVDDSDAVIVLLEALREVGAQEQVEILAERAATHAVVDDPRTAVRLLEALRGVGAQEQVEILAERAATHVAVDDSDAVIVLLEALREVGAQEQVEILAERTSALAPLEYPYAVARLLHTLQGAGLQGQVKVLAERAAAQVALDKQGAVAVWLLSTLREAGAQEQFEVLAQRVAALNDPQAVALLLNTLRKAELQEQVKALAERAAHVVLGTRGVVELLEALREAGAQEQVKVLAERAATHFALDNPDTAAQLLYWLRRFGPQALIKVLAERAAHAPLDRPNAVYRLLWAMWSCATLEQVTVLAGRVAAHANLDDLYSVADLLKSLWEVGAQGQVEILAERAAAHIALDDWGSVAVLLKSLWEVGAQGQVKVLAERAAHAPLGYCNVDATELLEALREVGAQEQVEILAERITAHAVVDDPHSVVRLLDALWGVGAQGQAEILAERAAAHIALDSSDGVARLLTTLREAELQGQTKVLTERVAAHAPLNNPYVVAGLLDSLRGVGAQGQTEILAERAAPHVAVDDSDAVIVLLDALRKVGAQEWAAVITARLPAAGQFRLFLELGRHTKRFRFGREPDGSDAGLWTWENLE
ncbi:hypothetical protein [Streptomyces sp. SAS_260]|uniref:hypothetical protein n=1 Tax=Streptomyces sp. SAS_260 TaxID=3412751 RepID=UPI00403CC55F